MNEAFVPTESMPVANAMIEILKTEGVPVLSAYPTTPLIDAASDEGLRPVLCRQERVGVGIADGFSRATNGRPPGVFAMQWGPGVENAYSGMATAFADGTPTLFIPMGYDQDREDMPRFYGARQLEGISKSVERIRRPADLVPVMTRAFTQMIAGRPGPVVVELAGDIATAPMGAAAAHAYHKVVVPRYRADREDIARAVDLLLAAKRPLILAGQGVLYGRATASLVDLAEFLDIPVASTLEGKSAFPEDHPLSLGTAGVAMPAMVRDAFAEADVVCAIGASLTVHPLLPSLPAGKSVIHVTVDPVDINKDYVSACPIIGDADLVLRDLVERARAVLGDDAKPDRGTASRVAAARAGWLVDWRSELASESYPINHYRVVGELTELLDPLKSIVTHDSGSPRDQITPFYEATTPRGYMSWGKSHGLGTGLGLIIGAKLAEPEKVCVAVMGDAAFGMVGLDFETAVRNNIPIVLVVLNNSTMAVETKALERSHPIYRTRDIGGEYADIGRALGGWARRVEKPGDIRGALTDAIDASRRGSAALVEVITSPLFSKFSHRIR